MKKLYRALPLAALMLATAAVLFVGAMSAEAAEVLLYAIPAAAATGRLANAFRFREPLEAFQNVVATGKAVSEIPRYSQTLLGVALRLGGTTFARSHITNIRLKLGNKVLYQVTAAQMETMNSYMGLPTDTKFCYVRFTNVNDKERGGELIGGIDMQKLPEGGRLYIECDISGATAPTLDATGVWGQPQDNDLIKKYITHTFTTSKTGRQVIPFDVRGALVERMFFFQEGSGSALDWSASASSAAVAVSAANTGNGTFGTVTVGDAAKVGVHNIVVVEPGANVGTFLHFDPDGLLVGKGVVATAYTGGGLTFTIADGATDFVAGDHFQVTVSSVSDGNLSRVEVKRDKVWHWNMSCSDARYLQKLHGRKPQSLLYVADFTLDNRQDGVLKTAGATSLEVAVTLTLADNLTIIAECLDHPDNN